MAFGFYVIFSFYPESHQRGSSCSVTCHVLVKFLPRSLFSNVSFVGCLALFQVCGNCPWVLTTKRERKKTVLSLICLSASYLDNSALHLLFLEGVGETFLNFYSCCGYYALLSSPLQTQVYLRITYYPSDGHQ
jgi:hypothetical protein